MYIDVLVTPSVDSLEEIEKAIKIMNQRQSYFKLRVGAAKWVEKNVKSKRVIDYDKVYQEKEKRLGESPVIVITKLPLKDGWSAYYYPGFYIISLGDWESRYQAPPLRVLIIYYLAGICSSFACNLPEEGHEEMYHDGIPIGCISDICPKGDDDILLSMKGVTICPKCTPIYKRYGCGTAELDAARRMLEYVQEEANKYDRGVPYDVFISYGHVDNSFVDQLTDDLEDRRLKVWRDGFNLLPGRTIIEQIVEGIDNSLCLLCVLSAKSVESPWVNRELAVAVTQSLERGEENIIVLPITIDNCKIPKVLSALYYVDFQSNYSAGLNKVLAAIHEQKDKRGKD